MKTSIILAMVLTACTAHAAVTVPAAKELVARLPKTHPRLLATAADFQKLKQRLTDDAQLQRWHADLRVRTERVLRETPSRYEIPDGLRLLATSRRVLERVNLLGVLYQLDGDRRCVDRAWRELEAAMQFPDWNPRHFLDTAEMTAAFAVGYDWFYDAWTEPQRAALRAAIVKNGFQPSLKVYHGKDGRPTGWAACRHNWNQVCNGGLAMGALAIGDVAPEPAGEILHAALQSVQLPMAEFAPDGAWGEGPGYWGYATLYNVMMLASLNSAFGTDFGLSEIPGFSKAGDLPIYMSGPTGMSFGYADCHEGVIRAPQLLWLAKWFQRPDWARHELAVARVSPLHLLWYDAALAKATAAAPVLDKYFRGPEVVTMRSAWNDPQATFVAFKAGDNKYNHSHLDIGTFALDMLGVRWATDLGADNYNLPGYFGKQRWDYYRLRAEGHNTLVINPGKEPDQDPKAGGKVVKFESRPERAVAVADLTAAYAAAASKVQRGIALLDRKSVLVQDEIAASAPAPVYWFFHTEALVSLNADQRTATLGRGKLRLTARILSPPGATFEIMAAKPLPSSPQPKEQGDNKSVRKLSIQLKDRANGRIAVWFTAAPLEKAPEVKPLAQW